MSLRKLKRIWRYWRGQPVPDIVWWADQLRIVYRFRAVPVFALKGCFMEPTGRHKRGFLIERTGTYVGRCWHDLSWYRRFVKTHIG